MSADPQFMTRDPAIREWLLSALGRPAAQLERELAAAADTTPQAQAALQPLPAAASSLLTAAQDEGLTVALYYALRDDPCWGELPEALTAGLLRTVKQAVAWEIVAETALRQVLDALAADGVEGLLLKGVAVAHLLYAAPHARPRGDTDLLVADRAAAERVWQILQGLGYTRLLGVQGRYVSHQFACTRRGANDTVVMLDIHWRLSNSNFFAQRFSFTELWRERRPIPALGQHAQALSARHALIHALFHRAWHLGEGDPDRLLWLYDIHLLGASFGTEDWTAFVDEVEQRGLQPLCRDGLQRVQALFGTPIPASVDAALSAGPPRGRVDQMQLMQPGRRRTLTDLMSLPTWRQRLGFIRETVFPDADYMRQRFGAQSRWQLPIAYLRRAMQGTRKGVRS